MQIDWWSRARGLLKISQDKIKGRRQASAARDQSQAELGLGKLHLHLHWQLKGNARHLFHAMTPGPLISTITHCAASVSPRHSRIAGFAAGNAEGNQKRCMCGTTKVLVRTANRARLAFSSEPETLLPRSRLPAQNTELLKGPSSSCRTGND
ncbi:hypothetical protein LshimejAT787_0506450 [Lyophyllum shimeji]|uniref:Uncharacterized protein n=1 Tax=Lyophyllum shimeji TaxID=47721 RepID=A0A9P3PMT8_LYOSH|nr:hypothetical protein LshimejAT787_0506450 [Lyophyllum shimeji]